MKKLTRHFFYHVGAIALLLGVFSCKEEAADVPGDFKDKVPENVRLSDYSNSSITVAWDHIEGATSYTVQLLTTKENDSPIPSYTTVSKDQYQFTGLEETRGYYVRVRANFHTAASEWVYVKDEQKGARIMPKYGFVTENFQEPELYPNFPEGWEDHEGTRKKSYDGISDIFPSGEWLMPNMYLNSTGTIVHKNGTWGLMMKNNVSTYLEMNFDLPKGASLLSFYYGTVTQTNANDVEGLPIVVKVEYSIDGGKTWLPLGDDLEVTTIEKQYFQEYWLDIKEPVRFRIGKNDSRARLLVDDIAVYHQ